MTHAHWTCCCTGGPVCYPIILCPCDEGSFSPGLNALQFGLVCGQGVAQALIGGGAGICTNDQGELPGIYEPGGTYIVEVPDGQGGLPGGPLCFSVSPEPGSIFLDVVAACPAVFGQPSTSTCDNPDCCEEVIVPIEVFVLQWCGPCPTSQSPPLDASQTTQYAAVGSVPDGCDVVQITLNGNLYCFEVIRPSVFVNSDTPLVSIEVCYDECEGPPGEPSACCVIEAPPTSCTECTPELCPNTFTIVIPALSRLCCRHDGTPVGPPCNPTVGSCNFADPDECPVLTTITFEDCAVGDPLSISPEQPLLYEGRYNPAATRIECLTRGEFTVPCQSCSGWGGCGATTCVPNDSLWPLGESRWIFRTNFIGWFVRIGPESVCPLGNYRFCRFSTQAQPPGNSQKIVRRDDFLPINALTLQAV